MANGFGLYDMAGKVNEWCLDDLGTNWYADPAASLPEPTGPTVDNSFMDQRVACGGGFAPCFCTQPPEGLDPLATSGLADADFDGDRQLNGGEFVAGTQPTIPASFFRVDGVGPAGATVPVFCAGVSGRMYTVETTTNLLADDWQADGEVTNSANGTTVLAVSVAGERRILRIKVRLAP